MTTELLSTSQQRIIYLDVCRILACCMIVLMHSPHPDAGNSGLLLAPLSFLTSVGVGLFFMVSGSLLLPVKTNTKSFLKKRLGKIVYPLLFWTFFYICINLLIGKVNIKEIPEILLSVPFSTQGHGVLWFLYSLVGLYLLAPIISSFISNSSKRTLAFYLFLWILSLCFPILSLIVKVNDSITGWIYYFSGYWGYFVLGFFLHAFNYRFSKTILILFLIIPFGCFILYKFFFQQECAFLDLFGYLSVFVVMMCVAWFISVRIIVEKYKKENDFLIVFSNCCFGIYLMHIFVMRNLLWNIDYIVYSFGGFGQIIITWLLTLGICLGLSYIISFLPFAEYIIGYKQKKQ